MIPTQSSIIHCVPRTYASAEKIAHLYVNKYCIYYMICKYYMYNFTIEPITISLSPKAHLARQAAGTSGHRWPHGAGQGAGTGMPVPIDQLGILKMGLMDIDGAYLYGLYGLTGQKFFLA